MVVRLACKKAVGMADSMVELSDYEKAVRWVDPKVHMWALH
jgi:hypothetical protein